MSLRGNLRWAFTLFEVGYAAVEGALTAALTAAREKELDFRREQAFPRYNELRTRYPVEGDVVWGVFLNAPADKVEPLLVEALERNVDPIEWSRLYASGKAVAAVRSGRFSLGDYVRVDPGLDLKGTTGMKDHRRPGAYGIVVLVDDDMVQVDHDKEYVWYDKSDLELAKEDESENRS